MNHITVATDDLTVAELALLTAIVAAVHRRRHPEPDPGMPAQTDPAGPPPSIARPSRVREPGDDDEPVEEETTPADGRQLLGWAAQQKPDAMPAIKQWGASKRIKAKIVDWSRRDVLACYAHVRGTMAR